MNITDRQADFCARSCRKFTKNGFRGVLDLRNEKIGFKIREHTIARIPYQLVIGDREVADRTLAVRQLGSEKSTTMGLDEFIEYLRRKVYNKSLP